MAYFREITEHFRIEKTLGAPEAGDRGEGGVFRAADPLTGTPVTLKLIPMADAPPESAQAFVRAMGLLQAIRHPSLPTLFDFGFTPDAHAFLVLEYVEGRDALALQGGSPAQILPLLTQVLEGLERMSKEGLAHHNLCPENLLVVPGPAPGRIQMAGLGTAALRLPGERPEREAAGYSAPEMSRPRELAVAPWRADLYSLARIACHLLEARLDAPRGGGGDDPQAPEVTLPLDVCFELEDDRGLKEILERSLRSRPDERPTFGELRQAFGRALSGAAGARALPESRIFVSAEPPEPEIEPWLPLPAPWPVPAVRDNLEDTIPVFDPEPIPPLAGAGEPVWTDTLVVPPPAAAIPEPVPEPQPALPEAGSPAPPLPLLPPAARPPRPYLLWGAAAVAVLVAATAAGIFALRPRGAAPAAVAPAPPPAVRVAPAPVPAPVPPAPTALPAKLAVGGDAVASSQDEAAPAEPATPFQAALKAEDLPRLATAMKSLTAQELSALQAVPGLRKDLAAARKAADLYQRYRRAGKAGDPAESLTAAGAVAAAFPRFREARERREKTAAGLEGEAETLFQTGAVDAALERLETLRHGWPERAGLSERIARYTAEQRSDQAQAGVLSAAAAAESRKRPEEGLAQLDGTKPTPRWEARFSEARARLESQLAQLDLHPPVVQLGAKAADLEFEKGAAARIPLKITDDYQVKTVTVRVRPEGGGVWTEMACNRSGPDCTIEVPESLHQNRTVEIYVVAVDPSGHKGQLGSPEKPQQIRRKHWYDRLRGKG